MSGIGSASASAASAGAPASLATLVEAELQILATEGAALRALLAEGDVVQAQVLPPNGLSDLLSIAGFRVAAALPPTLVPGDVITVAVTSTANGQITVQIVPPETPLTNAAPPLGGDADSALSAAAPGSAVAEPAPLPAASSVAPAPAVFAAAAVRAAGTAAAVPSIVVSAGAPAAAGTSTPAALLSGSIEARIGAARATVISGGATLPPPGASAARLNPLPPPPQVTPATAGSGRPFVAPPIVTRSTTVLPAPEPVASDPLPPIAREPLAPALPAAPRGLEVYAEPVALLRSLRLPVTPTNVASAKLALEEPQRLATGIATLERALPNSSADPRIATLRTIAGFIGRLDPRSPTLATQIASFVEHALEGSEPKLAAYLAATADAADGQAAPAAASVVEEGSAPAAASEPNLPTAALAQSAARATALQYDFKTQLLSLAQEPPPGATQALVDAVSGTLTALTALQLQTLSRQSPESVNLTLPIALPNGTANAQIRIDRDAPEPGRAGLDGDNFHIAFILETQSLGVVAIDLVTVGRTVTLELKTEAALAALRFSKVLDRLSQRLTELKYTVAKAHAGAVSSGTIGVVSTVTSSAPAAARDPQTIVDRSA